ncbi:filamin-binding LIM protein 1 isoform X1 [Accipiter gentilis]|uniref:filamin-binding LIM protein 1 isoform X1 n=2 Tax=Astur gentilis TaxID=8957 RepID=UPI002110BEC8|nr:filamin-binding LIM protein 1 isoform X1 [Accipiter gentilis]XP_049666021.1 filamin-binding LIM protein 1 isoform X1 [Accipiter gentilis]XP_049666119.1 filamin-binding LIM protein 1 isoform X1 [Accipiter gentilis]
MRPGNSSHRSGPSMASVMLPGKAEKRIASSVFITLVPPRREVVTKEKTQRELQPDGAEVPGTPHPQSPPPQRPTLPNGEIRPAAPVPSSPPVLVLTEAPQPLSAEALGPALQQLDLATPTTLQAPSALPAELRLPKFCREQAGKPQWQDANGYPERDSSRDICAFCHKVVGPREPTVEAMRKQYHADCFTCRTCHRLLAGQRYYQRDGRPTCDACYQATLEKCAKCRGLIAERIVRALGKGYHPGCFSCTACGRAIGTESFAVDERDEVYCVADFYRSVSMETGEHPPCWGGSAHPRHPTGLMPLLFAPTRKYAAVCSACEHPIVPCEDKDTYKIECLGRSFHESCYRCESCGKPLSPEPTENGCYPLDDHLLCKSCHVRRRNESSC